jgi:energy-coupling factor transport system ATP-binding protein
MPLITLDSVTFSYPQGATPALRQVSACVEPGRVILVRGASGSGKSTLLRCLNGLVPHHSGGTFRGTVVACGLDTRRHPPRELGAHVGFVFQHPEAQFILEDVEAELAFGLENLGLPRPLMRRRVEEVLDQVGITDLRGRRISSLSGGERQRVAIAAALATHPQALALDEPTSQLDPQAAEEVLQVVFRLVSDLGMTTLIAEHRVERIAPLADHVWTVRQGQVFQAAAAEALAADTPRPPLVELALRSGWDPVPISLAQARPMAAALRATLPAAPVAARRDPGPRVARLESVVFAYDRRPVLSGLSLDLRRREVAVLMGRNGAGKTTVLKLLAGILRPRRGRVQVDGRIGYVPQDADTLLFQATVRQELGSGDLPLELPAGVEPWLDRYPRDLSVGERQRVAIAATARRADLLLLDEPTRGLDPQAKRDLGFDLRRRADAGAAILVATHDVEWAARIADRVALIAEGEVYADGPPRQVLSDSLTFSTQVNKLLGKGWLLVDEVPLGAR